MSADHPQFTAEQLAEVRRLQGLYPDKRGALLPVLHLAQDTFGYISLDVEERLGVAPGETTPDGRVTFLTVECLCACEQAPMMQVDDRYEGNLTPEKVDRILDGLP